MKKTVIGTLAHVDAGKTTLTESMLYLAGTIRKLGRVDHGDTFLDFDSQERKRGITIFSKQSILNWEDTEITFIDTPGHIDFSAEMERTLQILDYAILIISGRDGVQSHTEIIWKLLEHYHIPTFIFVNKMDAAFHNKAFLMQELKDKIDVNCIDFSLKSTEFYENIAMCDEALLDEYLEKQVISDSHIRNYISQRQVFPVYFGSALKMDGIEQFLNGIAFYTLEKQYSQEFGAKVYKITRDDQGNRLTHMKITGGSLKVKEKILDNEKIDQIRQYSGNKYQMLDEVKAGQVCAIKGLKTIEPGMCLGQESLLYKPVLSSYMHYHVLLPDDADQAATLRYFQELSEEDPQLHVQYNHQNDSIMVQLMGEIQIEVLKNLFLERYHVNIDFDQGNIMYKETILETVEGVGHYEPLRHYAEVHLLLEPGPLGSGLQFMSDCSEEILDRHWQRLVLTHLEEKEHLGVLTGSPITDMKITLVTGKAHLKHTEGGDFRQATYRAIRQGLKVTKSILLEPYYQFRLEIPSEYMSKAIYDIESMNGHFTLPDQSLDKMIITGDAPVAQMKNYQLEVMNYTKGKGKLYCTLKGYEPCHNQDEIISKIQYDSEKDIDNPTGSIFCSHGAGFYVKWDEVKNYMHIPYTYKKEKEKNIQRQSQRSYRSTDEELEDIFTRTYGPIEKRLSDHLTYQQSHSKREAIIKQKPECLLVDGYNIIHSWPELKALAQDNLEGARFRLMDMMCNYQGYKKCLLILVFDAYKVKDNLGNIMAYHNIQVVYTKEAQTADMYIERATHEMADQYHITVATSDALEQLIVTGQGANRMSARELRIILENLNQTTQDELKRKQSKSRNFLLEDVKNYNHNK